MKTLGIALYFVAMLPSVRAAEPWATARGNAARTGCIDQQAGPATAKVLWVHRSQEHVVATPAPAGAHLYVAGIGALNTTALHALPLTADSKPQPAWTRSTPLLKLPIVSSPAVADGKLVFGDGMHQTDGAILHCLNSDGMPLWELGVPGTLVHIEGAPTVAGSRVFVGGGAAGVMCVERDRVMLNGKEMGATEIQKILTAKWAELKAKYEEDKKKDPDFAVPPNEDMLPKPSPVRVWQVGQEKWHVDAPVAVVSSKVLVASAFLDKEKVGDRAILCLDAATGKTLWRQPLTLNPWGGPAVIGDVVVVAGSTVNYDPKSLQGAKGELAAFDLATGQPKWRKDLPGGVVGGVALADGTAVVCATDGKVRAFDVASGERKWLYDAKSPLFAPPAVVAGVVYAGDLKGIVHAVQLADGKPIWKLDLGSDPAVKAPGMIYAGPVVHGGKLYVATCNLDGEFIRQPTVVVCIGAK
jgi:outer membrane protein assembly factor BamB